LLAQIEQSVPAQMLISIEWIIDLGVTGEAQAQQHMAINATVANLNAVITIAASMICF
jgi:hypothetical protein